MTYFEVDPSAIDRFADQLGRFRASATAVVEFIDIYQSMETVEEVGGQGLLNYFWLGHSDHVHRAQTRMRCTDTVAFLAELGFRDAAGFYRRTDLAAAERLDRSYPGARPAESEWVGNTPPEALRFEDRYDPREHLHKPEAGELQPKAAALASGVGAIADGSSMSWWARQILIEVVGRDPIKDVIEAFSGDWEAVARLAEGWMRCASTVSAMRSTMSHADEALNMVWKGNAADAAVDFVQRLTDATLLEVRYFEYLYEISKAHIDIAYFGYEMINYLAGELLDLLAEAIIAFLTSGTVAGPVFVGIWAVVDAIIFVVDTVRQIYHGYRVAAAGIGRPYGDEEPDFAMERLYGLDANNLPVSYQHPALR